MIKVMAVLQRKEGMTRQEFVDYWRSTHIPLVKTLPGIRKFVCNIVVDDFQQTNYPAVDQYDGCSELYFDDLAAADHAFNSDQGHINGQDALNFIGQRLFLATETVDVTDLGEGERSDTELIKVMAVLKRKDGMTRQEFVDYWRSTHIPLVKTLPGIRKFVCNIVVDDFQQTNYPAVDQYDGCSELYFDDLAAADHAFNSDQGHINGQDALNFIGQRLFLATRTIDVTDLHSA